MGKIAHMDLRHVWQTRAEAWIAWARAAHLDEDFWQFHLPHFLDLLPPPGRLTVDVGSGEGRLGRILAEAGYHVVGFDAAFPMVKAAVTHPRPHLAAVADATRLPLRDEAADLVTAFMCLHDFDDMPGALMEAARVLAPDGSFVVALHHPFVTARLAGGYAAEQRYVVTVEKPDQQMTYEGLHRPLAAYTAALTAAGLAIETLREPVKASAGDLTVPFLHLRARHRR